MRLKKVNDVKDDKLEARVSKTQKHLAQTKANIYCDGNLSEWIVYAVLNFIPDKSDLEEEKKAPTKKVGAVAKLKRKSSVIKRPV